jgi:hypothetical protein
LENEGAERTDLEEDSSTYQIEELGGYQNLGPQNQQHSTQGVMTDKYAARDKLDSRKVASVERVRALANLAGFSVHPSSEFKFGRVFKVLWTEPIGAGGTEITVPTMARSETDFHKVRRFVIIKSSERQAICV